MRRADQMFRGDLTDKELGLIEDALVALHTEEAACLVEKLYNAFWEAPPSYKPGTSSLDCLSSTEHRCGGRCAEVNT